MIISIQKDLYGKVTYRWEPKYGAPTKENAERIFGGKFVRSFTERLISAEPKTFLQKITVTRVVMDMKEE